MYGCGRGVGAGGAGESRIGKAGTWVGGAFFAVYFARYSPEMGGAKCSGSVYGNSCVLLQLLSVHMVSHLVKEFKR